MIDLSKKKVLVRDNGLFPFLAQALLSYFAEVLYFCPWKGSAPTRDRVNIGSGIGLNRVESFYDYIDEVDLICFFDVGDGDLQEYLRRQGHRVFGSGYGEIIEQDREHFKDVLKDLGMPVAPYRMVTGIDELRDSLKKEKDKFIKVSKFRGIGETFHHSDYQKSVQELDRRAYKLGGLRDIQEFMIEDPIAPKDGIELAADWIYSNGKPLPRGMFGHEYKNTAYIGKVVNYDDIPERIKIVNDGLAPVFKEHSVNGFVAIEARMGKTGPSYATDPCMRSGSPPSESISGLYKNLGEIVWAVAGGESVTPKEVKPYAAEIILRSEYAITEWCPLTFPKEAENNLKFRNLCKVGKQHYHIPMDHDSVVGAAVGYGDSPVEAEMEALEMAAMLDCPDLDYDKTAFEHLDEEVAKGEAYGLGKF